MAKLTAHLLVISCLLFLSNALITDEDEAWKWFREYSDAASKMSNTANTLSWAYATNMTDHNYNQQFGEIWNKFVKQVADNASLFDFNNFEDRTLKREFKLLASKGIAALTIAEFTELNRLSLGLESNFSQAKIYEDTGESLSLFPDIIAEMASGRDYDRLLWVWKNWRDVTGKLMREDYIKFVELENRAANAKGYDDAGDLWRQSYMAEGYDFKENLEELYDQMRPFYKQLHTYVKNKLKEKYGADKFPSSGHIPAHLLGNMWAQVWNNIGDLVLPYESSPPVDATPAIQNLTVREMFNMSDEFFTSLGLEPVTQEFWDNSMLEKPTDGRQVNCHPTAWDFNDGKDFRISQCTQRNMEDFITVHHEMGHVQYFMQYKDLLKPFRTGANPGFHEAVGDAIALSVSTPKHLKEVGLIDSYEEDEEANINYMMSIALVRIVFLPFGKLIDDYRWAIFDGSITSNKLNSEWWKKKCKYQGVSPPVKRTEDDFDAGALYHVPANVPYVRYFVSFILQFQFHKALCTAAGHTGPLHTCDIYRSKEAGKKFRDMLKLGASKEWTVALEAITGSEQLSAEPIIEYFQPLVDWLERYNQEHGQADEEWTDDCPTDFPEAETEESGERVTRRQVVYSTASPTTHFYPITLVLTLPTLCIFRTD